MGLSIQVMKIWNCVGLTVMTKKEKTMLYNIQTGSLGMYWMKQPCN